MASAVSASASAHDLPTSNTIHAENSCRCSRMRVAAATRYAARSAAGTRDHDANAACAASIAFTACSVVADWKRPRTSVGRAGFVVSNVPLPSTRSPPMTSG